MEIKVTCQCGTKFKFDVEPVHGRMPAPVACPSCGTDSTAAANEVIAQAQSVAPVIPVATPLAQPLAPSPPGLRIYRPNAPQAGQPVSEAPAAGAPPPMQPPAVAQSPAVKPKSRAMQLVTTVFVVIVVAFGLWRYGAKWLHRIKAIAAVATAVGEASVDSGPTESPKNLWYEKCAILFIRHTNHLEVAQAAQEFWKTNFHKNVQIIKPPEEATEVGEYELIPAHNGYVRILSAFEWPLPEFEGLAKHLSQRFGTLAFEWRSESFADTYHFGVYDNGVRKFHAQMDVKLTGNDADEIVTTEGNDYAIANGYKPGPDGFKKFGVLEADKITQHLGMKLWDEPEGKVIEGTLLKETGPAK